MLTGFDWNSDAWAVEFTNLRLLDPIQGGVDAALFAKLMNDHCMSLANKAASTPPWMVLHWPLVSAIDPILWPSCCTLPHLQSLCLRSQMVVESVFPPFSTNSVQQVFWEVSFSKVCDGWFKTWRASKSLLAWTDPMEATSLQLRHSPFFENVWRFSRCSESFPGCYKGSLRVF